eukprot:5416957-Amphidinium_carterae.1
MCTRDRAVAQYLHSALWPSPVFACVRARVGTITRTFNQVCLGAIHMMARNERMPHSHRSRSRRGVVQKEISQTSQ